MTGPLVLDLEQMLPDTITSWATKIRSFSPIDEYFFFQFGGSMTDPAGKRDSVGQAQVIDKNWWCLAKFPLDFSTKKWDCELIPGLDS